MSVALPSDYLNEMRTLGDPLADRVIASLFEAGEVGAVNRLMQTLVERDGIAAAELPAVVRDYLEQSALGVVCDAEQVEIAQDLFARVGPEMLAVLGFYGLPMDYAAGRGVQVLYRTAFLLERPMRRVLETTQMVVDVMTPGGLSAEGRGVRTAQKVRLMHAAVRHLIQTDEKAPWSVEQLGVPINQEDLVGTLMTFAYVVLAGLSRLGVAVSEAEREAYFQHWMTIGRLMGVRPDLIPPDVESGRQTALSIFESQRQSTVEGQRLANALLEGYRRLFPEPLRGMPASLMHVFLQAESLSGRNVAEMLDLPPPDWTRGLVHLAIDVDRFLECHHVPNPLTSHLAGLVGRELVRGFCFAERGGQRPAFAIPQHLHRRWGTLPEPS